MKKLIFASMIVMAALTSCKKDDCPTPTNPTVQPTREDSLVGVWAKYRVEDYRDDTLYSGWNFTGSPCCLSLLENGDAVEEFTYCTSYPTQWTLDNNVLRLDTIPNFPIVTWDVERLTADSLVLKQHYTGTSYHIKFYFTRTH